MIALEVAAYLGNKLVRNEQCLREAQQIGSLSEIERLENEIADIKETLAKLS